MQPSEGYVAGSIPAGRATQPRVDPGVLALAARLTLTGLPLLAAALLAACSSSPRAPYPADRDGPGTRAHAELLAVPDAQPRIEPLRVGGPNKPYEVLGQAYEPMRTDQPLRERGLASWYGRKFHGRPTASGEIYDMYAMTAAHKTLPLPCYARVTNLANGKSVVVRVNDRGPFVTGRIIDLSYTAAAKLDMLRNGTAFVEMRVITPGTPAAVVPAPIAPPPALIGDAAAGNTAAAPAGGLYLQAGAFADSANARRQVERLRSAGIENVFLLPTTSGGRTLHRVRIGPIDSVAGFDALSARLARIGITDARLAPD